MQTVAAAGTETSGSRLPFLERVQQSFGPYDVHGIRAHTDRRAATSAEAIGAKAFAFGDAVAFAGRPDLYTVAHEAAHVVQQRYGVVPSDGVGSAGDRYERNADAVASAVVRGESAAPLLTKMVGPNRAETSERTDGRRVPVRSGRSQTAVQRLIGFEIETGVHVEQITDKRLLRQLQKTKPIALGSESVRREIADRNRTERFTKGKQVTRGVFEGFSITADDAQAGKTSEIEFITDVFDESDGGQDKLRQTMWQVMDVASRMENLATHRKGEPFLMAEVTGNQRDVDVVLRPTETTVGGKGQITAGIALSQLPNLVGSAVITEKERETLDQDLLGLLALIRLYISMGLNREYAQLFGRPRPLEYHKKIADTALLRTDFATTFGLLDEQVKQYYRRNPDKWVNDVLVRDFDGMKAEQNPNFHRENEALYLFDRGVQTDKGISRPSFTVSDWLRSMLGEGDGFGATDRLLSIAKDERESLSSWTTHTETVGPPGNQKQAPVIEYRAEQGTRMHYTRWGAWAIRWFQSIMNGHRRL